MRPRRDYTRLTPERRELAASYIWLARKMACGLARGIWRRHAEDFEGEALLALTLAARRFDDVLGDNFEGFAAISINWAIAREKRNLAPCGYRRLNRMKNRPAAVPKIASLPQKDSRLRPHKSLRRKTGAEHGFVEREAFEARIARLSPAQRDVLRWKYVDGLSYSEIAAKSGKTGKSVDCVHVRARARLLAETA